MRNFKISEFDSPDLEGSGEEMIQTFLTKLDDARDIAGIPFIINSGYRTKDHNESVGGKPSSSHLKGLAVDISCKDSRSRSIIINSLIAVGLHRIGISKTFIHVDNSLEKDKNVIWLY